MSFLLQTFSASGVPKLIGADRVMRSLGTIVIGAGVSGSIVNDGFLTGEPFFFCTMSSPDSPATWYGESLLSPTIVVSGNTLYYTSFVAASTRIHYGVF